MRTPLPVLSFRTSNILPLDVTHRTCVVQHGSTAQHTRWEYSGSLA